MVKINKQDQKNHFENPNSHFDEQLLLQPELYQQIELDQLKKTLNLPKGSSILDFGCGRGRISLYFLQNGYNVHSVDISSYALKFLQGKYKKNKTKTWGKLTTSEQVPTKANFDAIVGADVLHHVPIEATFRLFKKALKPGGKIVFSEPNAYHLPWYLHFYMNNIPFDIEKGILDCTVQNFQSLLKKTGFKQINISGHGIVPTKFLNFSPMLCNFNAKYAGNIPLLRQFAYRFTVSAVR